MTKEELLKHTIPDGYIIVPASAWDELVQIEAERDALVAQVESLHKAIYRQQRKEGWYEEHPLVTLCIATPQQHLAEIRAEAVIAAIDAHKNNVMTFGFDSAIKVTDLIKYAEQLRQGGAE